MHDWIGWVATSTFASSYFSKHSATLRRIQALAAVLWMSYGVLIHALPVIVANAIVAAFAIYSSFRPRWTRKADASDLDPAGGQEVV